jgi:N-acetylglucosamine malate deacetylase 1
MKLDVLVLAAHPDDAELGCGGTILVHLAMGKKVGLIDLTRGELGTRGTAELRSKEAAEASSILVLTVRGNLGLADGFFNNDEQSVMKIIEVIRKYQPDIVLANAPADRHPDHGRAAELSARACFLSGLVKIKSSLDGEEQTAWRPRHFFNYIQDRLLKPDFIVDISAHWDTKVNAIKAFKSQFFNPDSQEPETYISTSDFMVLVESRARELGHHIGVKYGEGFLSQKEIGIKNFDQII